jgi:hypothetical protein
MKLSGTAAMRWYWLVAFTLIALAQGAGLLALTNQEFAAVTALTASYLHR